MKHFLFLLAFIVFSATLFAQDNAFKNEGSWLTLVNKIVVSNRLYSTIVVQQRRINFLKNSQAILVAPSVNYKVSKNITFGIGYMRFTTFPSGSNLKINKNENRFFQDLLLTSSTTNFKFTNRFRFEQRKIEKIINVDVNGFKKVNRLRYRVEISKNLFHLKNKNYIIGKLSNEVRIRLKQGLTSPDFDQNNFAFLLGTSISKQAKIWLGYGNYFYKKNENNYLQNHLLHVKYTHSFDLRK